ncbi:MAG: xanthine dehydrogenase family protein subunit M [Candidatus Caldarchaeum sp.]|nr:xanthine dehydrogenase family protein subunit M [Candidatus Caldarchaeum sp.]
MKTLMPYFEYVRPSNLEEALNILEKYDGSAEVLAGGTDLLVKLKDKLSYDKKTIIDINRLRELDYVRKADGVLAVGALTRIETLSRSKLVRETAPLLAEVAYEFGTWQIRNTATLGGNLANASNANDYGVALMVLDAKIKLKSVRQEREVSVDKFFLANHKADIRTGELLVEISFPVPSQDCRTAFVKMEGRESSSYPVVNSAALTRLSPSLTIEEVRIAVGGVSPTPLRLRSVEERLRGLSVAEWEEIESVLRDVRNLVNPSSSNVASKVYRAEMSYVYVKRALQAALSRTGFYSSIAGGG